jgi:hypothetical protein
MAGTLVVDTISNGTVSTSTANVINGAKAWVNFSSSGGTITVRASYNISSVVRNATGYYTINFTNALADANYSYTLAAGNTSNILIANANTVGGAVAPTASAFSMIMNNTANSAQIDNTYINIAVFR